MLQDKDRPGGGSELTRSQTAEPTELPTCTPQCACPAKRPGVWRELCHPRPHQADSEPRA